MTQKTNILRKLADFLGGKKTFIVAITTVLYAVIVVGWQMGDWNQASQLILVALGLGAVRHAI